MISTTHSEELTPPSHVGLLEQGQKDPPGDAAEADPEAFPLFPDLEEMKKYIYRGGLANVSTEDPKHFDEGPTIRV